MYWFIFTFILRLFMWQLCSLVIISLTCSFWYRNGKLSYGWCGNYKRLKRNLFICRKWHLYFCLLFIIHRDRWRMKDAYWKFESFDTDHSHFLGWLKTYLLMKQSKSSGAKLTFTIWLRCFHTLRRWNNITMCDVFYVWCNLQDII